MSCAKSRCSTDRANYSNLSALTILTNPIAGSGRRITSEVLSGCGRVVVVVERQEGLDHVSMWSSTWAGGPCFTVGRSPFCWASTWPGRSRPVRLEITLRPPARTRRPGVTSQGFWDQKDETPTIGQGLKDELLVGLLIYLSNPTPDLEQFLRQPNRPKHRP
jgi:hypothetical protein